MFKNKSILITGGTGSFGKGLVKYLIKNYTGFKKIIIFSRDELKQFEMATAFNEKKYPFIRYFIGDVRDLDRLKRALEEVDYVIHAAALKQVEASEYNPFEAIKTNVVGAQNVIEACLDSSNVKKIIALSTDKAVSPVNLYGATKLCSDKLFVSANNMVGGKKKIFSVVRYGNVMGSRGSVIPEFIKQKKTGIIKITDPEMTRFNITMTDSIKLVLHALDKSKGGEIFVPKIPSYKITTLAKAISDKAKINIIGIRPGEKIHEELISYNEAVHTVDIGKYYVILSPSLDKSNNPLTRSLYINYLKQKNVKKVKKNFQYNSGKNPDFLNVNEIKKLIKNIS
ncbi:UDP-N-acetylglucosamine 4,6-dehydratase (inverting) [Candidatus Pelagibacter sp.]|jgi:UDP-N-acetylglucosamine 4,6-dehydratase/5-epimerase|nr:UDP-N-acetylglucosamine 4,6-dehydratase (inverting) [Candidatus Pelagibacter sp.]|tara:strand:- start:261 stop:1280 length:1020 start_codon:yes stop_codon:yes gene_type:complete